MAITPNHNSPDNSENDLYNQTDNYGNSGENVKEIILFERLLSNLSAKFVHLPATDVDSELDKGLELIVNFLGVDRSAIMEFSDDQSTLQWTHYYGTGIKEKFSKFIISSEHPWFSGELRCGETIVICDPKDIKDIGPLESEWMIKVGMKSNVTIPLAVGGAILGGIAFSSFSNKRTWPDEVVSRLRLVGEVFASALMRKRSELKLKRAFHEIKLLKDQLYKENIYLKEKMEVSREHEGIIGKSIAMKQVLSQIEQVASTKSTVLILGETGTGKELFAKAVHKLSPRANRALVKVNCAGFPSSLVESELFGREKGAYTGALTQQLGRFEVADGSTIFLDEIGELEIGLQAKLLRVLQEGQFERLGSPKTTHVDVRIIAATNRDLDIFVKEGKFREDLYYRLNVFPILAPALRDRREDIPPLIWAFIREFEETMGKTIETVHKKSMDALMSYSWPGNVRELRNTIERAMILCKQGVLNIEILQSSMQTADLSDMTYRDAERIHILRILDRTGWRVRGKQGAAEILDLKPSTLESKMVKLNIVRKK